ncbi:MAG TPA: hypothetical protein VF702_03685 [Allosphingosinicella sp.]|jgi:hypothetical protein
MASRYAAAASRRNSPIDLPLAAAAALAVGFAAFVMPDGILTRLVEASGLPSVLSAAQPPLGTTARVGVSAAAAFAAFAAVFLLLRRLGGRSAPAREQDRDAIFNVDEVEEMEAMAPRLRRADVHPDAPARRPILAARELGEPETPPAPAPSAPARDFTAEPAPASLAPESCAREPVLDALDLGGPDIEMIAPEPVAAAPREETELPAPAPAADASIAELMERLERGFARKLEQRSAAARPAPVREAQSPAVPAGFGGQGDDRLRSAMENLQKMAARAG